MFLKTFASSIGMISAIQRNAGGYAFHNKTEEGGGGQFLSMETQKKAFSLKLPESASKETKKIK